MGGYTRVALALGGNRWHGRHGAPAAVLRAAARALAAAGLRFVRLSTVISTAPLGPSRRYYANAVLLGDWPGSAAELHGATLALERGFGRRSGQRWGARTLDIDIIAFGDARISQPGLTIPHPRMAERAFVLDPLAEVWPRWRHPATGLTAQQMRHRLHRPRPLSDALVK